MRKGLTELVFILDRSGSMSGLESDTLGGFNSMLEKQKKETGEAFVSVVLFDNLSEVLYDRVDIHKIEPMNDNQYFVRGCTALLDAIGGAIHHIGNVHKYAKYLDIIFGSEYEVIPALVLTRASDLYTWQQLPGSTAEVPVCSGDMLFNLFDEYYGFLKGRF